MCPTHPPDFKPFHPNNLTEPKDNLPEPTDNIPESTSFMQLQNFDQTIPWQIRPNLTIFTILIKFQNIDQISQFLPNFTKIHQISQFQKDITFILSIQTIQTIHTIQTMQTMQTMQTCTYYWDNFYIQWSLSLPNKAVSQLGLAMRRFLLMRIANKKDSPCSCGHFEMCLTSVGLVVPKLYLFCFL